MNHIKKNIFLNIATSLLVAMFFSCTNKLQDVRDFLAEKNLPVGTAKNINLIYTDSGKVTTKLISPLMLDFSNKKKLPYQEYPKGIEVISFDKNKDSTTLTANYGITYLKTNISKVKGNVEIVNYAKHFKLNTELLFWNQNTHYVFTEKKVRLIQEKDTTFGVGFEANEDLTKASMKSSFGTIYINEK